MRIVGHIDLDAFFASVEERDKPYLRGLPVVVGADPKGGAGRGVVSTANYAARKYGIRSALPIKTAWRLSEEAKARGERACAFIAPSFSRYRPASKAIFDIVAQYTPCFEQSSIDEAYLDLSHLRTYTKAREEMEKMKREIRRKTKLSSSIGIGPSKLVAKIASDVDKPNGLTVVRPKDVEKFLGSMPVRAIPGIGPKAAAVLQKIGVEKVADARMYSWEELEKHFGKWGFVLYERVRGIDEREVLAEPEDAKSIGKHKTFAEDMLNFNAIVAELRRMSASLIRSLSKKGFVGFRTVVLTVRFADFTTRTRSVTSALPMASERELNAKMMKLLLPFFEGKENPQKKKIRLVGLRIEKLL
ncbi:DNA polymerase IV [Candidatus Kaiserbacteria bacterium CG10_big_fil_rev_8_21_14_0_10_49_17]|uniref:DNA polymerase IV n=1 Tax=Candidatus Kaiserbacteria bacterium CG10_big_fil_rev_8_21_14_0_10_49_17 TaxID=1974609 RepID=A0A2M6WEQ8_9BACT|nr:MAG: DNA polymerase IV [Candidatus Kaiserbacteria bacterium CG10_big_fil_rev_8_21_14_0_10_49_17]